MQKISPFQEKKYICQQDSRKKRQQAGTLKQSQRKKQMKQEQKNDYKRQDLTEREKAVIIWGIVTGCKDWKKIYLLSRENPPSSYSEKNTATAASRFKLSAKVRDFVQEQNAIFAAKADQIRNEAGIFGGTDADSNEDTKTGNTAKSKKIGVDFTNTDEQLKYLAGKADEVITDEKQRFEIIKLITEIQKRTQADDGSGADIQRFYTSLRCRDCVLYQQARESDENSPK